MDGDMFLLAEPDKKLRVDHFSGKEPLGSVCQHLPPAKLFRLLSTLFNFFRLPTALSIPFSLLLHSFPMSDKRCRIPSQHKKSSNV